MTARTRRASQAEPAAPDLSGVVLVLWSPGTGNFLVETLGQTVQAGTRAMIQGYGLDATPVAHFAGEDAQRRAEQFAALLEAGQARKYGVTRWGSGRWDNAQEARL